MDELKFVPSEAVWEEVAKQIRERRDRRRLLIWWLLFPLLAGGSFGIYITNKHIAPAAKPALTVTAPGTATGTSVPATGNSPVNTIKPANKPAHATVTPITKGPGIPGSSSSRSHEAGGTIAAVPAVALAVNQQNIPGRDNRLHVVGNGSIAGTPRKLPTGDKTGIANKTTAVAGTNPLIKPVPVISANMDAMKPARVFPLPTGDFTVFIEAAPPGPSSLKSLNAVRTAKADKAPKAVKKPAQHEKKMEWVLNASMGGTGISSGFSLPKASPAAYDNIISGGGGYTYWYTASRWLPGNKSNPGFSLGHQTGTCLYYRSFRAQSSWAAAFLWKQVCSIVIIVLHCRRAGW